MISTPIKSKGNLRVSRQPIVTLCAYLLLLQVTLLLLVDVGGDGGRGRHEHGRQPQRLRGDGRRGRRQIHRGGRHRRPRDRRLQRSRIIKPGLKKCSPKVHGQQDKFKGTQLQFSMITKCTCLDSEDVTALACCMRWLWFVAAEDDDAEPEDTAEPEDALCRGNTR